MGNNNENLLERDLLVGIKDAVFSEESDRRDTVVSCELIDGISKSYIRIIQTLFSESGINTLEHFWSPEEAIDALRGDLAERTAIILSSQTFPVLKGADLASFVDNQESLKNVPLIISSGTPNTADHLHPRVDAFLEKPSSLKNVHQKIMEAFLNRLRLINFKNF